MKKLITRSISGIVYALLIIGSILIDKWALAALSLVFLILGSLELKALMQTESTENKKISFVLAGILLFAGSLLFIFKVIPFSYFISTAILSLFLSVFSTYIRANPFSLNSFSGVFMLSYLAIPLVLINSFSMIMVPELDNRYFLICFFLLIWINDTFAYFTGSLIGRRKLAAQISPGKTWEGTIGGLIFTLAASYGMFAVLGSLPLHTWLGFGFLMVVFGTLGDLLESVIKRNAGKKDSGNLIPGHGGILDRIDSMIIATPFTFVYFYLLQ